MRAAVPARPTARRLAARLLVIGLVVGAVGCRSDPRSAGSAPDDPTVSGQADAEPRSVALRADPTPVEPSPVEPSSAPPASPPSVPSTSTLVTGPAAGPGPAPPPTAAALGAELARVETALRDAATPADLTALGLAQQVAYRQLAANPAWRPQVLGRVPPALRGTVNANTDAEVRLASMHTRRPTSLPKWRIVPPPPAADVLAAHQAAAAEIGVPWPVLAAIHLVETRMGRIRGTSTAGARGPMQFLPSTWAQYGAGADIEDLPAASKAAARLLKRNGVDGNPRGAVYSYNHSEAYVDAVLAYAGVMAADPRSFLGYHGWQVFYRHAEGDTLLPEGWHGA